MSRTDASEADPQTREALVARWLELTRAVLPAMAAGQGWPIRFDHCFMRVCLDHALGSPWTDSLDRPAIRHMSEGQLRAAVAAAEAIVAEPCRLRMLNEASLRGRRATKAGRAAR